MAPSPPSFALRRGRDASASVLVLARWGARLGVLGLLLSSCAAPTAKKKKAAAVVPEACLGLLECCDRLPADDAVLCRDEAAAAGSLESGGIRCSRALAEYRDRGFCGGSNERGPKKRSPGCALFADCCASLELAGDRGACVAELDAYAESLDGEDACLAAHDERVTQGICAASPVKVRGPACAALVTCCYTLAPDARAACVESADQINATVKGEPSCEASRAAYDEAGLCKVPASSCPLTEPKTASCCHCGAGKTCAENGCYNDYLCDPAACRCVARPTMGACATP